MATRHIFWVPHTPRLWIRCFLLKPHVNDRLPCTLGLGRKMKEFFQKSKPAKEEVELTRTQSLPMKVVVVVGVVVVGVGVGVGVVVVVGGGGGVEI